MTKYILHGGVTRRDTEDNTRFFREMVDGLPDPVRILCVYFARPKERWQELFKGVQRMFSERVPERILKLELADVDPSIFMAQIKNSDVVYLTGGNTHLLRDILATIPELEQLWNGKVIAGSSAGAMALSSYYYENDDETVAKGLGILPIKIICHFSEDKAEAAQRLTDSGEDLPIYKIPEEQFVILNQ